jgi:hypothetical protein
MSQADPRPRAQRNAGPRPVRGTRVISRHPALRLVEPAQQNEGAQAVRVDGPSSPPVLTLRAADALARIIQRAVEYARQDGGPRRANE